MLVYYADIEELSSLPGLEASVPSDRRITPGRAAAYTLLRLALRDFGHCPPDAAIVYNGRGKPSLRDWPNIHFSLSHGRTHVLAAVDVFPVGADVETIREMPERVFARTMTAGEHAAFIQDGRNLRRFFELWSLKESMLKLLGDNSLAPTALSFRFENGRVFSGEYPASCAVFDCVPGCSAAVCFKAAGNAEPTADIVPVFIHASDILSFLQNKA